MFCYADLTDVANTIIPTGKFPVFFGTDDSTRLVGQNPIATEAGTATVLLESDTANSCSTVYALSLIPDREQTRILGHRRRAERQPDRQLHNPLHDGRHRTLSHFL